MKIRHDFVTNSSSASFVIAVASTSEVKNAEDVKRAIIEREDLGDSYYRKLDPYISTMTVEELDDYQFRYAHGEHVRDVDYDIDDRANFLPDTKIFVSEIYAWGDDSPGICDLVLEASLREVAPTVLVTEVVG